MIVYCENCGESIDLDTDYYHVEEIDIGFEIYMCEHCEGSFMLRGDDG